jgi:molecular chaperone DnaK
VLGGTDIEAIKDATEKLVTSSQSFAQKLYEQASASQQASEGGESAPADAANDDEVIDAEIVDE